MLRLISAAESKPVSLDDLKKHCRVDHNDDNDVLGVYLDAASAFVADRTSLVLQPSTFRIERSSWWSGCLNILVAPVREIVAVKYRAVAGDEQTVDEAVYRWRRTASGAVLEFVNGFSAPSVQDERFDAVTVEVRAGFDDPDTTGSGDDPELILPPQVKQAILLTGGAWYETREAVTATEMKAVPFAVDALIGQVRLYR